MRNGCARRVVTYDVSVDARQGVPLPFRSHCFGVAMTSVECKPARRERIREILIEIAAAVVSNLLVTALVAMAGLLF